MGCWPAGLTKTYPSGTGRSSRPRPCGPPRLGATTGGDRNSALSSCTVGRGAPIPESSTDLDQRKCGQASGRHVGVLGIDGFKADTVSGGVCIGGPAHDRVHVGACGSFAGDSAMTPPYSSIGYLIDDPRSEVVNIYLSALFHQ